MKKCEIFFAHFTSTFFADVKVGSRLPFFSSLNQTHSRNKTTTSSWREGKEKVKIASKRSEKKSSGISRTRFASFVFLRSTRFFYVQSTPLFLPSLSPDRRFSAAWCNTTRRKWRKPPFYNLYTVPWIASGSILVATAGRQQQRLEKHWARTFRSVDLMTANKRTFRCFLHPLSLPSLQVKFRFRLSSDFSPKAFNENEIRLSSGRIRTVGSITPFSNGSVMNSRVKIFNANRYRWKETLRSGFLELMFRLPRNYQGFFYFRETVSQSVDFLSSIDFGNYKIESPAKSCWLFQSFYTKPPKGLKKKLVIDKIDHGRWVGRRQNHNSTVCWKWNSRLPN